MTQEFTMTLESVMESIRPPMGISSLIGAPHSVSSKKYSNEDLVTVINRIKMLKEAQDHCHSDYAWWGYEGQLSYWKAVQKIIEAFMLVNFSPLPYIKPPNFDGEVLMDACSHIEKFGDEIYEIAKKQSSCR